MSRPFEVRYEESRHTKAVYQSFAPPKGWSEQPFMEDVRRFECGELLVNVEYYTDHIDFKVLNNEKLEVRFIVGKSFSAAWDEAEHTYWLNLFEKDGPLRTDLKGTR